MALAYASVQTSNSGTTSVVVTKPTSLAEGDYMVAHLASSNASATDLSAHTLSGWTSAATAQSNSGTASHRATCLYKVASAGDVAASDFTFTCDADAESSCGAIYRFTGAGLVNGAGDDDATTTADHTFANTITPTFADSILLFLASCVNNGGTSFSTYAITTNNPTWTERYDVTNTGAAGDGDTTMAGATGPRAEVTATGNSTVSSGVVTDSVGLMVAVYPQKDVTVSPSVISLVGAVQAPSVAANAIVTVSSAIGITGTVVSPTVTTATPTWTNIPKS